MNAWRRSWIVGAAAIAWTVVPATAQLSQIGAMTLPNVEIDFDAMPGGPTSVSAINAAFSGANITGIRLTAPTQAEGFYNTNPVGRALAGNPASPTGASRPLFLVEPTNAPFGAFSSAVIGLGTTATQFGWNIGDWNGPMNIAVRAGGVIVGDLQVDVAGAQNVFVQSTTPFDEVELTLHAIGSQALVSTAGNWVIPTLLIETGAGQTFLVTERNASTIWEWDPATGSTSVFHRERANDADYNQIQGSPHGWLVEHFNDYFARFDIGSGSGLNAQYTTATRYAYPKHIAVFDNSVVVMSRNDGRFWRYTLDGQEQVVRVTGFSRGQGLATDGTDLYVSVWNGSVSQFLQYNTRLQQIAGPIPNPTGMGANNNILDFAYDGATGHWFGLATIGEGGTGTQTNQVVEFTMGGSVVATYTLPFMADGFGLAGVPGPGKSLTLCYDVVDIGGGLFEYTFVCEIEPGWAPGMGWQWFVFGDERHPSFGGTGVSPLTDFAMTSSFPVGPWGGMSITSGEHNGPTFTPPYTPWIPASASETLTWSGTSTARLNPGEVLFSTIAWTIGGAVAANFKVATERCSGACPCACDWDPDPACNIFDFLAFQTGFVAGDPCACEFDPDPACNIFDFLAFQTQFVTGCP